MANSENIGGIAVDIVGDYSKLVDDLQSAQQIAAEAGAKIAQALSAGSAGADALSGSVESLAGSLAESMSNMVTAATGAVAAIASAFGGLSIDAPDTSAVTDALATMAGAAQTAGTDMKTAFDGSETSAEALARAGGDLQTSFAAAHPEITNAGNAAGAAAGSFGDMASGILALGGISLSLAGLKELAGEAMTASDNFTRASISLTAITGSGETAKSTIEALEALGMADGLAMPSLLTAATRMTNMLPPGTDVVEALGHIADSAAVMGTGLDAAVQKFDTIAEGGNVSAKSLATLGIRMDDLKQAMTDMGVPAAVMEQGVTAAFKSLDNASDRSAVLSEALSKLDGVAHDVAQNTFAGLWQPVANQFEKDLAAMGEAAKPLAQSAIPEIGKALGGLVTAGQLVVTGLSLVVDGIVGLVSAAVPAVQGMAKVWVDVMKGDFKSAITDASDALSGVKDAATATWKSMVQDATSGGDVVNKIWDGSADATAKASAGVKQLTTDFNNNLPVVTNVHAATKQWSQSSLDAVDPITALANAAAAQQIKVEALQTSLGAVQINLRNAVQTQQQAQQAYDNGTGSLAALSIANQNVAKDAAAVTKVQGELNAAIDTANKSFDAASGAVNDTDKAVSSARGTLDIFNITLGNMGVLVTNAAPPFTPFNQALADLASKTSASHVPMSTLIGTDIPNLVAGFTSGQTNSDLFNQRLDVMQQRIQGLSKTDIPGAVAAEDAFTQKLIDSQAPHSQVVTALGNEQGLIQKLSGVDLPAAVTAQQGFIDKLIATNAPVSDIAKAYQDADKWAIQWDQDNITVAEHQGTNASQYIIDLDNIKQHQKDVADSVTNVMGNAYTGLLKTWNDAFTSLGTHLTDAITGAKSWHDAWQGFLQDIEKEVTQNLVKVALGGLESELDKLLGVGGSGGGMFGSLINAVNGTSGPIGGMTKGMTDAGNAAETAAVNAATMGQNATTAAGTVTTGIQGAGQAATSAVSSFASMATAVSSIVGALAGIAGDIMQAHANNLLDDIEKNTRSAFNELTNLRADEWSREDHLLQKLDDMWRTEQEGFGNVYAALSSIGANTPGGGSSDDKLDQIWTELDQIRTILAAGKLGAGDVTGTVALTGPALTALNGIWTDGNLLVLGVQNLALDIQALASSDAAGAAQSKADFQNLFSTGDHIGNTVVQLDGSVKDLNKTTGTVATNTAATAAGSTAVAAATTLTTKAVNDAAQLQQTRDQERSAAAQAAAAQQAVIAAQIATLQGKLASDNGQLLQALQAAQAIQQQAAASNAAIDEHIKTLTTEAVTNASAIADAMQRGDLSTAASLTAANGLIATKIMDLKAQEAANSAAANAALQAAVANVAALKDEAAQITSQILALQAQAATLAAQQTAATAAAAASVNTAADVRGRGLETATATAGATVARATNDVGTLTQTRLDELRKEYAEDAQNAATAKAQADAAALQAAQLQQRAIEDGTAASQEAAREATVNAQMLRDKADQAIARALADQQAIVAATAAVGGKVDQTTGAVDRARGAVNDASTAIGAVGTKVAQTTASVDRARGSVEALPAGIGEVVNPPVVVLTAATEAVGQKVDQAAGSVDRARGSIDAVNTAIGGVSGKVDQTTGSVDRVRGAVDQLPVGIGNIVNPPIISLTAVTEQLPGKQDQTTSAVDRVRGAVDGVTTAVTGGLNSLGTKLDQTTATVDRARGAADGTTTAVTKLPIAITPSVDNVPPPIVDAVASSGAAIVTASQDVSSHIANLQTFMGAWTPNAGTAGGLGAIQNAPNTIDRGTVEGFFSGATTLDPSQVGKANTYLPGSVQTPDWAQKIIDEAKALNVSLPLILDAGNRLVYVNPTGQFSTDTTGAYGGSVSTITGDQTQTLGQAFYNKDKDNFSYANISSQDPEFKTDPTTWKAMIDAIMASGSVQQVIDNYNANVNYAKNAAPGSNAGVIPKASAALMIDAPTLPGNTSGDMAQSLNDLTGAVMQSTAASQQLGDALSAPIPPFLQGILTATQSAASPSTAATIAAQQKVSDAVGKANTDAVAAAARQYAAYQALAVAQQQLQNATSAGDAQQIEVATAQLAVARSNKDNADEYAGASAVADAAALHIAQQQLIATQSVAAAIPGFIQDILSINAAQLAAMSSKIGAAPPSVALPPPEGGLTTSTSPDMPAFMKGVFTITSDALAKMSAHIGETDAVPGFLQGIIGSVQDIGTAIQKGSSETGSAIQATTQDIGTAVQKNTLDIGTAVQATTKDIGTAIQANTLDIGTAIQKSSEDIGTALQKTSLDIGTALRAPAASAPDIGTAPTMPMGRDIGTAPTAPSGPQLGDALTAAQMMTTSQSLGQIITTITAISGFASQIADSTRQTDNDVTAATAVKSALTYTTNVLQGALEALSGDGRTALTSAAAQVTAAINAGATASTAGFDRLGAALAADANAVQTMTVALAGKEQTDVANLATGLTNLQSSMSGTGSAVSAIMAAQGGILSQIQDLQRQLSGLADKNAGANATPAGPGVIGISTPGLPHYALGGYVPQDMVAVLHAGEYVLPPSVENARLPTVPGPSAPMLSVPSGADSSGGGWSGDLIIQINGSTADPRAIADEVIRRLPEQLKLRSPKFTRFS